MMIAYGIICFLEALVMYLGIGRGRNFNLFASILAVVAIGLQAYGFTYSNPIPGYIHFFAHEVVIFTNGFLLGRKSK